MNFNLKKKQPNPTSWNLFTHLKFLLKNDDISRSAGTSFSLKYNKTENIDNYFYICSADLGYIKSKYEASDDEDVEIIETEECEDVEIIETDYEVIPEVSRRSLSFDMDFDFPSTPPEPEEVVHEVYRDDSVLMSGKWTDELEEILIVHIEKNPSLWDMRSSSYKNKTENDRLYMDIARQMNKTPYEVEKKFVSLKEKYRKIKKANINEFKSGMAARKKREWHLQEKMKFLDPIMVPRKTTSFDPCNTENNLVSPTPKESYTKEQLQLPSKACAPSETPASKLSKEKRNTFATAKNAFAEIFEATKEIRLKNKTITPEQSTATATGNNRLHNFGKWIAEELIELPKSSSDIQIEKIANIIFEAKQQQRLVTQDRDDSHFM